MYEARQNKEKVSRILPLLNRKCTQLLNTSHRVIQRQVEQYQGDNINDLLNMDISFITQGITCDFKRGGKRNGANWISKTTKVRVPRSKSSYPTVDYLDMACHLNITYSGASKNTRENSIQISIKNSTVHWTIRSIQNQREIDENDTSTVNANLAFHKSSGIWNTSDKKADTKQKTIESIGIDPNSTRLSNVNISETKKDLEKALIQACYNYNTTVEYK